MGKMNLNQKVPLELISREGGTQKRALDQPTIEHYMALMQDGIEFPAIEVVLDGSTYWLWDGFHRYECYLRLKQQYVLANVQLGGKDLALWLSYSANKSHGLPRGWGTVRLILREIMAGKWKNKTSKAIAEHVGCSCREVQRMRKELDEEKPEPQSPKKKPDEEEKKKTPPSPIKDSAGNLIPKKLIDRWLSRSQIQARIRELDAIKQSVHNSIHNRELTYLLMTETNFKTNVLNLRDCLKHAIPHALCPYCNGKGCKTCKRFGFVNERTYKMVEGDKKK